MDIQEAVALIERAVPRNTKTWVDVGAGEGTFTRALVELLGPDARVYAVDRDARALGALHRWATRDAARITPIEADFTDALHLPERVDGMLLANALHFVPDPGAVLARLVKLVRPGGRVVVVEYDRRWPNPWVPYPIASKKLPALAAAAGLSEPTIMGTRPSAYSGTLYAAAMNLE